MKGCSEMMNMALVMMLGRETLTPIFSPTIAFFGVHSSTPMQHSWRLIPPCMKGSLGPGLGNHDVPIGNMACVSSER